MIKIAIKAAKNAGKILLKYHGKVKETHKKKIIDSGSIVTKADIESEKEILKILQNKFPSHNIYSEESGWIKKGSEYTWYIDPLDGTLNFSRNIDIFGISIGLTKNGKSILGVLYFPKLKLLVYAEKGKGAFANGKRIRVSKRNFKRSLYFAHTYYNNKLQFDQELAKKMNFFRSLDCSSYELAQIARGNGELYLLESIPHDVVAGDIIVKEAGGKVTDHLGKDFDVNSKNIIVSNKIIHKDVLKIVKKNYKKSKFLK